MFGKSYVMQRFWILIKYESFMLSNIPNFAYTSLFELKMNEELYFYVIKL